MRDMMIKMDILEPVEPDPSLFFFILILIYRVVHRHNGVASRTDIRQWGLARGCGPRKLFWRWFRGPNGRRRAIKKAVQGAPLLFLVRPQSSISYPRLRQ
jgi:hypothetical protein